VVEGAQGGDLPDRIANQTASVEPLDILI